MFLVEINHNYSAMVWGSRLELSSNQVRSIGEFLGWAEWGELEGRKELDSLPATFHTNALSPGSTDSYCC